MAVIIWDIRVTDAVDHLAVDQSLHIQELCTSSVMHIIWSFSFVAMVLSEQ